MQCYVYLSECFLALNVVVLRLALAFHTGFSKTFIIIIIIMSSMWTNLSTSGAWSIRHAAVKQRIRLVGAVPWPELLCKVLTVIGADHVLRLGANSACTQCIHTTDNALHHYASECFEQSTKLMCSKSMHWTSGACGGSSLFDGMILSEMPPQTSTLFHCQVTASLAVWACG